MIIFILFIIHFLRRYIYLNFFYKHFQKVVILSIFFLHFCYEFFLFNEEVRYLVTKNTI